MSNYQFAAFTEAELLAQGSMGSNVGRGDSFVMPQTTSTVFDVVDNDPYLSGDRRDNAADRSGQIATVTENGTVTSSGEQIYAEVYFWVQDQAGNWYIMIEVEIENTSGDYFTFFGNVPPAGSELTIYCQRNVCGNWVDYTCLQDPEQTIPPLAADDAITIDENETGTLNVMDNDFDTDGTTITVTAVEGGTVGQPFVVESPDGFDAMVTLNSDGSLTVVPGPEFSAMAEFESTTLTFTYTITDEDGLTSTATVTVNVNGLGGDAAVDDAITVFETETFGDTDANVLDNDIDGDASGSITITAVNGAAANIGATVVGSNGGLATINADGTLDFSANGEFDALETGQSATTTFTYEVETGTGTLASQITIPITGPNGFEAEVTVVEVSGTLQFSVEIFSNGGHIGDLRGLFFDVSDEGLLPGLSVSGPHLTDSRFLANAVNDLGQGNNVNGLATFDAGTEFGTPGMSTDDIRATTFTLSHSGQPLDLSLIAGQDFGLRATSVGPECGPRCDSLKLGATADGVVEEISVATVTVTVLGESDVVLDAVDDAVTVFESETFGDTDGFVLPNDTLDGLAFTGDVAMVGGDAGNVGQWLAASNGGLVRINADGSFDFDANGEFDALTEGQTTTTSIDYTIMANGPGGKPVTDSATLTVTVEGEPDGNAGGPVLNLAIMMNSALTMFEQAQTIVFGIPQYQDWNDDGVANQVIDMAYVMLENFMTRAYAEAADAGVELNLSLISFDEASGGEGLQYQTLMEGDDMNAALDAKVYGDGTSPGDNSANYGQGFSNADAWFDAVAGTGDTNAVFFFGNGLSADPWASEHAALLADHGALIDAFLPDALFSGAAYTEMGAIDRDGAAEAYYTDDFVFASNNGITAGQDALSLSGLLA